jgi:hypothetical protein
MLDQDTCARPVIVTLPGQITTANAEQAAERDGSGEVFEAELR